MSAARVPRLTVTDHNRDQAGMRYVYPVVSRRAGGVSAGINLNPNNACNWACIYCQVPGLTRGASPWLDLDTLENELATLLRDIVHGDFLAARAPEGAQRLNDIALSGNGEPTSSAQFRDVVEIVARQLDAFALRGRIAFVLITNGSLLDRLPVQDSLTRMAELGGEVWFKVDRASPAGLWQINRSRVSPAAQLRRLQIACARCPTWVQTCLLARDGTPPAETELTAYLAFLARAQAFSVPPRGVLLYGLARPSLQPEAPRLSALPGDWLETFAARIRALGLHVKVSP
jgi:wyosine [tRNA(Phe)-imidazoG37] synthetase (radical SAM superfamily)